MIKNNKVQSKIQKRVIKERKISNVFIIMFFFSAVAVLMILYWLTAPYKLFTFNKVTVQSKQVQSGEAVVFHYSYCKETNQPVRVTRYLVGTKEIYLSPAQPDNVQKKECVKDVPVAIDILPDRRPDIYYFEYKLCAQVNPLREVCEKHDTPTFKVSSPSAK